jgi:hypothetical protein
MSGSFWRPSNDQRDAILLLEVAGLLHDLGKLSNGFLKDVAQGKPQNCSYDYESIADPSTVFAIGHRTVSDRFDKMLKNAGNPAIGAPFKDRADITSNFQAHSLQGWDGQSYNLAELLLAQFASQPLANILGKSFQPANLIRKLHGVAHYEKEKPDASGKQPYNKMYSSSPFGIETLISVDVVGADLTSSLSRLPLSDISKIHTPERLQWLEEARGCLTQGLAETQRPTNEVSLWDWGYTVATLTKAAAAWIFKKGWSPTFDLKDLPYRTLRINLDILERYTRSDKISDLLGVRKVLDKAFRRVQTLLEETYALGNCFYHDETGAYYLFPDLYSNEETEGLRQEIQAQFPPDLWPQVHLGKQVTVGELDSDKKLAMELVAEPRKQALALRELPVRTDNNLYLFEAEWTEGRPENAEICMVCGVRPVGYPRQGSKPDEERELAGYASQDKAERRNVCRICLDRRRRRAQDWAEKKLHGTIWTDEVADNNGRLALFVGKLGLEGWLDGTLLDTIQVARNTTKTPSPTRLYRIAETARAFWKQASDRLMPDIVKPHPFRLAMYPKTNNLSKLGDFHTYELDLNGVALNVVWDKPNGRFLTADNLTYFADRCGLKRKEFASRIEGRKFQVLEPSAFLRPGQLLVEICIERIEELNGYQPAIPLLAEPSVCLMLVPADKAVALARAVKREYEEQMGRVRDRLPIYLGLVFCHRRTPIRALLEAGRAMLEMAGPFEMDTGKGWDGWRLMGKNSPTATECELCFDNGVTWHVPVVAGDGTTKDEWYPRMYEGDSWAQRQAKLVGDLQVCSAKKAWIRPSQFDFEFLDATGRRFEIHYDEAGRRPRRTRPFYLEDLDRFDELWKLMQRLAVSQRYQVIHTIEATRETWYGQGSNAQSGNDEVFKQFVADTLAGAAWPKGQPWNSIPQEWRDKLIQAGVSSELADLAELHMEILKEK